MLNVTVTGPVIATVVAESASVGSTTTNVCAAEAPPPGAGVTTVIVWLLAVAVSLAVTVALSSVRDTNVVVRETPLN